MERAGSSKLRPAGFGEAADGEQPEATAFGTAVATETLGAAIMEFVEAAELWRTAEAAAFRGLDGLAGAGEIASGDGALASDGAVGQLVGQADALARDLSPDAVLLHESAARILGQSSAITQLLGEAVSDLERDAGLEAELLEQIREAAAGLARQG